MDIFDIGWLPAHVGLARLPVLEVRAGVQALLGCMAGSVQGEPSVNVNIVIHAKVVPTRNQHRSRPKRQIHALLLSL